ncbi:hypothetical protein [Schlesneria sp.]|uniref:hypothetical protein n=1 Tax=Schlesneria sp. TaxID=2762018 RepID=UPI002EFF2918
MSGRSSCPECGTTLRIRDRSFIGRRVNCPECKTALRITETSGDGQYGIRRLTPDELASHEHARRSRKSPQDKIYVAKAPTSTTFQRLISSPLTAAWLLAIAISVFVAVLALRPKHRLVPAPPPSPIDVTGMPTETLPENIDTDQQPSPAPVGASDPALPVAVAPSPVANPDVVANALEPFNRDAPLPPHLAQAPTDIIPEDEGSTFPPPPPKVDVEGKLTQRLLLYKQSKPVSRRDLLEALQEHLGAPILYDDDDLGRDRLSKTMTFELENTTVGGVLQTITDSAGWTIQIEATGLRLRGE